MRASPRVLRGASGKGGAGTPPPLHFPKPSMPDRDMPHPQRTGIQWKVTEQKDWTTFKLDVARRAPRNPHHRRQQQQRQRQQQQQQTRRAKEKDSDDHAVRASMPLEQYMQAGLAPPHESFADIPVDDDEVAEMPTPQSLLDAREHLAAANAATLDADILSSLRESLAGRHRPATPPRTTPRLCEARLVDCINLTHNDHLRSALPPGHTAHRAARGPTVRGGWTVISLTQRSRGALGAEELGAMLSAPVVMSDMSTAAPQGPILTGSRTEAVLCQVVSVGALSPRVIEQRLRGTRGILAMELIAEGMGRAHTPPRRFRVLLKADGFGSQVSAESVGRIYSAVRQFGLPNYFSESTTRWYVEKTEHHALGLVRSAEHDPFSTAFDGAPLLLDESAPAPVTAGHQGGSAGAPSPEATVLLLLAHACFAVEEKGLPRFLTSPATAHPLSWTADAIRDGKAGTGLGQALLGALLVTRFSCTEALGLLRAQGWWDAIAEGVCAEAWNRAAKRRLKSGGQRVVPGDLVQDPRYGALRLVSGEEGDAAGLPPTAVLLPTLGVHHEGDPVPLSCTEPYREVLQEMGVPLTYPVMEGSCPEGFPLELEYRPLVATLADLDWEFSDRAKTLCLHPEGPELLVAGQVGFAGLFEHTVSHAASPSLVISMTIPEETQLPTVVRQLMLSVDRA